MQNRNRLTDVETKCMVIKGKRREGKDKLGACD